MFQSVEKIFSYYIDKPVSRYTIEFIEVQRIDIEDFFFLCKTNDAWYLVYETDFIDDLEPILRYANDIFGDDFRVLDWLSKKNSQIDSGHPLSTVVHTDPESHTRHGILRLEKRS